MFTASRRWLRAAGCALAALTAGGSAALAAEAADARAPVPAPAMAIEGPSPDLAPPVGLGLSLARDGTGALVYLKQVAGVEHVFASLLERGSFQPPEQLDPALVGPTSQPVVAAGNGGLLQIAFVNGGQLYVVGRTSTAAGLSAPTPLLSGAMNPALQMTNFGKAYLAFTAADGSGHDVRAAYYYLGRWSLETSPLNAIPADDAGTGTGRPRVAAAGDGVAIVAWGEGGHIYSRRVWATSPSIVFEQADAALPGCTELSADEPVVAAGGDSSYADVAFHELLSCGSQHQSRVLMNRLHGSVYDGLTRADGLSSPPSDGADQPQVAMTEYGHGWVTSARTSAHDVYATALGDNGVNAGVSQVNSLSNASPPSPLPAVAGLFSDLITWQQDPGGPGLPEVRIRYAPGGFGLGPELVVSSPLYGPTNAASGLAAGGDVAGDAAVAWVQGTGASTRIVASQLYQPPGSAAPLRSFQYVRVPSPSLAWSPAGEGWGPVRYLVRLDGLQVAQTGATALRVPAPLGQGAHTWQVTAVNQGGLASTGSAATVFVDTVAPAIRLALTGKLRAKSLVHIYVSYTDAPAPLSPAVASGIAKVVVSWGDGTHYRISHGKFHVYARPGRYKMTVTVKDRAGNTTTVVKRLKISRGPVKRPQRSPRSHARPPKRSH